MKSVTFLRGLIGTAVVGFASVSLADVMVDGYVTGGAGGVVKNSSGDCWRSQYEQTSDKLTECGYPAPAPVVDAQVEVVVAPTAATMTEQVKEKIVIGAAMLFGFDSAELSSDAKAVIDERIQRFRGNARLTSVMRVEGHTDSTGPEAYNLALSQRRAQSVADYIVSQSYAVKAGDIEVVGRGESEPVASNATAEGRAENRRVVVYAEGEVTK